MLGAAQFRASVGSVGRASSVPNPEQTQATIVDLERALKDDITATQKRAARTGSRKLNALEFSSRCNNNMYMYM